METKPKAAEPKGTKDVAGSLLPIRFACEGMLVNEGTQMSLTFLKLLTILLPIGFLVLVDVSRHGLFYDQLHTVPGFIATSLIFVAGVTMFSLTVFGIIERLRNQLLEQNKMLSTTNRIADATAQNLELPQLLETALDQVLATMAMPAGVICTFDQENEELSAACHRGLSEALIQRVRRAKLSEDPIGAQVVRTGEPVVMERLFENPAVGELARREGIRSALSVPLRAQGEVTGVLAIVTPEERHFSPEEVELLTSLGSQLGMAIRNSILYEKAYRTNAELLTLLAVGNATTSSLLLSELLSRALDAVLEVTDVQSAEVWLVEGQEVVLSMHRGASFEAFLEKNRLRLGEGFPGMVVQSGSPLISHSLSEEPWFLREAVKKAGFQTFGAWPLARQGRVIGVLAVASTLPEALTKASERRLLDGIREQLAIAIENALLSRQMQDAATLEERERIAREMHDGLAQVLGYINTQILVVRKLVLDDSTKGAVEKLGEMQQSVQELYAEVREGILGLRSSRGERGGLVEGLEEYLDRYRSMAGFDVDLSVQAPADQLRLPSASETQLVRIIQEALSNIRKHANASKAVISINRTPDGLKVEVSDNGSGFDPGARSSTGWPRFGLQTMRERAEAVGGHLTIESAAGKGTKVVVKLPTS